MQENVIFFSKIFCHVEKKQYLCIRFSTKGHIERLYSSVGRALDL